MATYTDGGPSYAGGLTSTITDKAADVVEAFKSEATKWGTEAQAALAQLAEERAGEAITATTPAKPSGVVFTNPVAPVAPDVSFSEPLELQETTLPEIQGFETPNTPKGPSTSVSISATQPDELQDIDWGTAPTVIVPETGEAPEIVAPEEVVVGDYTIPTFSGFSLPDVSVMVPGASLPSVSGNIDYSSTLFESEYLDAVMIDALEVVHGRLSIAQHIWDSIWSRVAGELTRQAVAIDRKARREHSRLGWSMPGNLARQAEAKQDINEKISQKALETAVQQATMQREDYWKAIETINAGVGLMQQADATHQERLLKVAIATHEAEVAALDAAIKAYNALLQAVTIEMQSKELEIKNEGLRLEAFKTELEGVKIETEIDKNRVALYNAQWEGQKTKVQAYAAWVDSIKTYVEAQKAAVEAYAEEVKAKQTIVQAWGMEWDAYTKKLEVPRLEIQLLGAQTQKYATDVSLLGQLVQSEQARANVDLEKNKLTLQQSANKIQQYQAQWAGIDTKLRALTAVYTAEGQVFAAQSQSEVGRLGAITGLYSAEVQAAQQELQAKVAAAQNALGYWQTYSQSITAWQSAVAGTYAQLGSAAYAAANVSLGSSGSASLSASYSESDSTSTSTSYTYSGEA